MGDTKPTDKELEQAQLERCPNCELTSHEMFRTGTCPRCGYCERC